MSDRRAVSIRCSGGESSLSRREADRCRSHAEATPWATQAGKSQYTIPLCSWSWVLDYFYNICVAQHVHMRASCACIVFVIVWRRRRRRPGSAERAGGGVFYVWTPRTEVASQTCGACSQVSRKFSGCKKKSRVLSRFGPTGIDNLTRRAACGTLFFVVVSIWHTPRRAPHAHALQAHHDTTYRYAHTHT